MQKTRSCRSGLELQTGQSCPCKPPAPTGRRILVSKLYKQNLVVHMTCTRNTLLPSESSCQSYGLHPACGTITNI